MKTDIYGEDASVGNFGFDLEGTCRTLAITGGPDADRECDGVPAGERTIVLENADDPLGSPLGTISISRDGTLKVYDGDYPRDDLKPIFEMSLKWLDDGD